MERTGESLLLEKRVHTDISNMINITGFLFQLYLFLLKIFIPNNNYTTKFYLTYTYNSFKIVLLLLHIR